MQLPNHRPGKLDMLSQHAKCNQAIPACRWPIRGREVRHAFPACSSIDKLSQHAVPKSEARKARHAIPACNWDQSQVGKARHAILHTQHRHTIPACTVESKLYKRGCKSPQQWTSWHSEIIVQLEETSTRRTSRASSYNIMGG